MQIAIPLFERLTAAGGSSGIDMALRLVEIIFDATAVQAAQIMIEYDPHPPFNTGSLTKPTPEILERVTNYAAQRD